jgi:S-adenosylmethionine:tRNA ribosyltransferase-isomerase
MLVIDRGAGTIAHHRFADLASFVQPGDLFVFNDTRVVPARFFSNDCRTELLRVERTDPLHWRCLVRPGKRMKIGRTVEVGASTGTVTAIDELGYRLIAWDRPVDEAAHGELALPPYMERGEEAADHERYQTVYAREDGAVAAPTAGLHFTPELIANLPHTFLTLHVGSGTFRPVQVEDPAEHRMHEEAFHLSAAAARMVKAATRVLSVGTTVTRVLEHLGRAGPLAAASGRTDIFIYPPYQFRVVDVLLTNFHLPKSTLLMLVSAFAGRDLIMQAYQEAVRERYRFFSYGDCMLII